MILTALSDIGGAIADLLKNKIFALVGKKSA